MRRLALGCAVGVLWGMCAGGLLNAQEPVEEPVSLHGVVALEAPEGAENQDASGGAYLRQMDDRAAIHVHVRGLTPGATYDVVVAQGDVSESIGTITTRSGEPPAPRHFQARLTSPGCGEEAEEPADPGEPGEGEGEGGGGFFGWHQPGDGDGERHDWMPRLRDLMERMRHGGGWPSADCPKGHALLVVNTEGTEIRYHVHVLGLEEAVDAVSLQYGEGDAAVTIPLDEETLRGTLEATEELLAALAAGEVSVDVQSGDEALQGVLESRFNGFRERMAAFLAARGCLRLDTARGDVLPLGATSIEELVGAAIAVEDEADALVLLGEVGELLEGGRCHGHWRPEKPEEPADPEDPEDPGTDPDDAGVGAAFFEVTEAHDSSFIRGDANDDGVVDLSDSIAVLQYLFLAGSASYCGDAADVNDDGSVEISDPIAVLQSLFQGVGTIPAPFPERGFDPTADELSCGF